MNTSEEILNLIVEALAKRVTDRAYEVLTSRLTGEPPTQMVIDFPEFKTAVQKIIAEEAVTENKVEAMIDFAIEQHEYNSQHFSDYDIDRKVESAAEDAASEMSSDIEGKISNISDDLATAKQNTIAAVEALATFLQKFGSDLAK